MSAALYTFVIYMKMVSLSYDVFEAVYFLGSVKLCRGWAGWAVLFNSFIFLCCLLFCPLCRFCSDCRHNVVHAYDLLMGKVDITESEESEDEFNEELFQPFGDRLCSCNQHAEKVLHCDVMDVEDLIYWHQVRIFFFRISIF